MCTTGSPGTNSPCPPPVVARQVILNLRRCPRAERQLVVIRGRLLKVRQDLCNHFPLFDAGNHLELATNQVIQWSAFCLHSEPRVLHVALNEAALFEHLASTQGNLLHQFLQLASGGCGHVAKRVTTVFPRQGKFAHDPAVLAADPAADVTVERIGDLLGYELADLLENVIHG